MLKMVNAANIHAQDKATRCSRQIPVCAHVWLLSLGQIHRWLQVPLAQVHGKFQEWVLGLYHGQSDCKNCTSLVPGDILPRD